MITGGGTWRNAKLLDDVLAIACSNANVPDDGFRSEMRTSEKVSTG